MKKVLSIFFLIIFLSTSSIGGELLKIPDLIEHFIQHQDEEHDHDSSFIEFLKEHYSYNSIHNTLAKHSHKNLPYKTIDAHAPHIVMFSFQLNVFSLLQKIPETREKPVSYTNSFLSSTHLEGIWQPPRFC